MFIYISDFYKLLGMKNSTFVNEKLGIGEMIVQGDQTASTAKELIAQSIKINEELSSNYGGIHTLIDVTKMGKLDLGSKTSALQGLGTLSFDKAAIVGANGTNEKVIELLLALSGRNERVKLFDNRTDAVAWLTA